MKRTLPLLAVGFSLVFGLSAQSAEKPFRVVIDPGHGGSDHGATHHENGRNITEKELTLLLSQEIAGQLRSRGISVLLTRETDEDVPLPARTTLANKMRADVFLSIHMNSTASATETAEGVETFILNNASDAPSHRLAHFENKGIATHTQFAEQTDTSAVALILKDLQLDANVSESKRLACAVQNHLVRESARVRLPRLGPSSPKHRDRGVKQALFYVLLGADMPSALVEAGFMNSSRDRALVLNPNARRTLARGVADAIEQFKRIQTLARGNPASSATSRSLAQLSNCQVH